MSVARNVYLKLNMGDKSYYFKQVFKVFDCDGNVQVRPIKEETYVKNLLSKNHRNKKFEEYSYEDASPCMQRIVDEIEETGKVKRVY